jgi:uncharacterized protein (DUF58 family)
MIGFIRKAQKRFYDGPALFNFPGRRISGYRSPNVLIGQWLHAFTVKHFTVSGRMLILITGPFFVAGLTTLLTPVYFLSLTLVSLFIADFVVGWLLRPRVAITRTFQESSDCHALVRINYTVRNIGRLPAWNLYVDAVPLPIFLRPADAAIPYVDHLGPGEEVQLTREIVTERRGSHLLPLPTADSAFPFGLWRWGCHGLPTHPLLVYPDYARLSQIVMPSRERVQHRGISAGNRAGHSMEFLGCREYRHGDNPRHIHAQSWARLGQPIVKEFREETMQRITLVVDVHMPPLAQWYKLTRRINIQFEAAMSLTAAIADRLHEDNFTIDMLIPGHEDHRLRESGRDHFWNILEVLACLDEVTDVAFPELSNDDMVELAEIGAVILVLLDWDARRRELVQDMLAAGIQVKVIIATRRRTTLPLDVPDATVVLAKEIVAGHVTEL